MKGGKVFEMILVLSFGRNNHTYCFACF